MRGPPLPLMSPLGPSYSYLLTLIGLGMSGRLIRTIRAVLFSRLLSALRTQHIARIQVHLHSRSRSRSQVSPSIRFTLYK